MLNKCTGECIAEGPNSKVAGLVPLHPVEHLERLMA